MSEIEKCVCGHTPNLEAVLHTEGIESRIHCYWCGRASVTAATMPTNPSYPTEPAIKRWNHDMRGLRLLREVARLLPKMLDTAEDFASWRRVTNNIEVWAREGDRE